MEKETKSTEEFLEEILSGDTHKVWSSSCYIMHMSQNEEKVREFIPYLEEIKRKTENLVMGGGLAPNKRFVDKAIRTIEFYKNGTGCSCCLLGEEDNPNKYETIDVKETVNFKNSTYVDYYFVECKKCKQKYKVKEREYHYFWWEWIPCQE